jgi:phosphoribosylanthranilate isomerase
MPPRKYDARTEMTPKVKICGLKTEPTLDAALDGGADFVGFNFFPPSPRSFAPEVAHVLAARARGRARTVAVLVDPDDALLQQIVSTVEPDLIQLHGKESPKRVAEIARRFGRPLIKALSVTTAADADTAQAYRDVTELVLFDAKAPPASAIPGGNGLTFDWRMLDGVRGRIDYMLSGGITADNVAQAIRITAPFAVDVSSGVETAPGVKSTDLIRRFLAAAKPAYAAAHS